MKNFRFPLLLPTLSALLMLGGCGLFSEKPLIPAPLGKPAREATLAGKPEEGALSESTRETVFLRTPQPPAPARTTAGRKPPTQPAEGGTPLDANIDLQNLPLPQFIEAVFVHVLKRNVSVDPTVQSRADMVSLRTGKPQTAEQLFAAARAVLRSYGVAINEFDGLVRIVPDNAQSGYLPEIRRGRALPEVPAALRPIFYLVELEHGSINGVVGALRALFPGRLTITEDGPRNALLLSGQADTMNAALETIQLLDQPLLRGRLSVRITPVFWSADELARRLVDILSAEGYQASLQAGGPAPLLLLPIAAVNSVIVFAASEAALNHTLRWARELDQPAQSRSTYITYHVRNTVAADLAKTLQEVMTGAATSAPATGSTGAAGGTAAPVQRRGSNVVVNTAANSLIIQTTPTEYQQWHGLLQELDRPARSALVMATVAEVRLTESEQFGFQWLAKQFVSNGYNVNMGTFSAGTTPTASAGSFRILFSSLAGDPRALLTMLASSNKIRILSNPSIVARNGESATIQVGQEVPILTSQVTSSNTGTLPGGGSGILQTIQYRNTGVILKVKPVIHAGGRVDLDVAQEVSAAQANETGVNSSPIILTRRLETKMSVNDGDTVLLGGLMQEQKTGGNAGIPLLKDIPFAGALFRTSMSDNFDRTELVVLLTPYVIEDDFDARAITAAFRNQFSWAATLPGAPAPSGLTQGAVSPGQRNPPAKESAMRTRTYELPEVDVPEPDVAPKPQSGEQTLPTAGIPASDGKAFKVDSLNESKRLGTIKADSAENALGERVPEGKEVTDERLREELMETMRATQSVRQR